MIDWRNRSVLAAAAAVLLAGFSVGFLTAKATDGLGSGQTTAQASGPVSSLFGKPRDKNAPRATTRPEGFAFWKQRLDTSGASPAACAEFSRDLDPSKPYADYVVVSPALPTPPAVTVRGAELCVSGLGFSDRRITLLKGLPGKGDDVLAKNVDLDFAFGEQPPYVGFAGNGVILPREDADGVAIETLNVSALEVEVLHVSDRNLVRKYVSAPEPVAEGEWSYDWGDDSANDIGVRVWEGKLTVDGQNGQRATTVLPLGAVLKTLKPGAYVIKVRDAGRDKEDQPAQARRWVIYTDMAMTTYRGSTGIDAVVRSLKTARPLAGVKVDLVAANGDALGEARTDMNGRVTFADSLLKGTGALEPRMLMAYGADGDYTATDLRRSPLDLTAYGVGGRRDEAVNDGRAGAGIIDGYLYTDRGIYRPGEKLHLVALVRDREGKAIKDRKGYLVVYRPSGVEAFRYRFDKTPQGYAGADIDLPRTAPRGQWRAELKIEGIDEPQGRVTFAVEDFAPQRLGVEVAANKDTPLTSATETRPVKVQARYLYGATASGLEVTGEARIRLDTTPFPALKDYRFGDDTAPYEEKYIELPRAVTDGEGAALFPLEASVAGETMQPLSVMLTASVYEPGGRPVRESQTLKLRQSPLYLGVKTETQETPFGQTPRVRFGLIGVDATGKKIAVKGVQVRLIAENWDYDWYVQDGRWQYRRTSRDVVISTKTHDLNANTGFVFDQNLDWGDYRIELTAAGQQAKTVVRFASGWGSPSSGEDAPDQIRLTAPQKTLSQGDTVEVTIKAPYAGEAQIAVATDRLIDLRNVSIGEGGTTIRLKTSSAWGGGAYVMVSVMQPRDPVKSAKPRRAVGLLYVPLDAKSRTLGVEVALPQTPVRPQVDKDGKGFIEVPVAIKGGRLGQPVRLSVAAVDQGILNLTRFRAPHPGNWYFGKRALGVDFNDDYGRLLDPNLGAPAKVNFGGDQIGGEGLSTTPIRTVALWSGVVQIGMDGKATIKLPISKFNGELKIMAVAWTDDAVGSAEERLVVREPVVMDLALPRFLSPGDKAFAMLELTNVDGVAGVYNAVVKGVKGLIVTVQKAFNLGKGQRVLEAVELQAPDRAGVSQVNLNLSGPNYSFADRFEIETRTGWGPVIRSYVDQQGVGQTYAPPQSLMAGLVPGSVAMEVSYSPFRGIDPAPVAATLSRYPYGCTEQIVSAATPWIYVSPSMTGADQARPAGYVLQQAVGRILDRQAEDGSFGLWRVGDGEADGFIGAYTTDFMLEARRIGASVPQAAVDRSLSAMRALAAPGGYYNINYRMSYPDSWTWFGLSGKQRTEQLQSRTQAYALYVLAKGGQGDLSRLRWYHDVRIKSESSPLAAAQAGAGLAMMGDKARARSAFKAAVSKLGYDDKNDWYQTPLRDLAGVIALAYEAGEVEIAKSLIPRLEQAMKSPSELNTIEAAYVLRAASYMLKASGPVRIEARGAKAMAGGQNVQRFGVDNVAGSSFRNTGSGPLWRTVTVFGSPATPPGAEARGLSLSKTYYSLGGARLDPSSLQQGQRVIVLISGTSSRSENRPIIIDDPLAAGFEVESTLTTADTQDGPFRFIGALSDTKVQEARDDRYVAALDVSSARGFSVAYMARVVTPGDFYLPGAEAKDMYRSDLYARTSGGRTVIAGR